MAKKESVAPATIECSYTPDVETYIFDDNLLMKAEKVFVLCKKGKCTLAYMVVDLYGCREFYDPDEHENDEIFTLTPDQCIIEGEIEGFLFGIKEEFLDAVLLNITEGFKEWNVDSVKKTDGTVMSIDNYVKAFRNEHGYTTDD